MAEILVAGGRGLLGTALVERLGSRAVGMDLPELDVTCPDSVNNAMRRVKPRIIINTAALTDVDHCQDAPDLAFRVHRDGVRNLARTGTRLLTFSTDHVFTDGTAPIPEDARPGPANSYGMSKLAGEHEALGMSGNAVIRTSWLFDLERGMVPRMGRKLIQGGCVKAVRDQTACVTFVPHLLRAVLSIVESGESGLFHCVNPGGITPLGIAERIAARFGTGNIQSVAWRDLGLPAPRPSYSVLGTLRRVVLPPLEEALEEWMRSV